MKTYLTVYFGTVLMSVLLVPVVSRLAKRYHLVDTPGPRKVHKIPVPRLGGIVFIVSTFAFVLPVFFLHNVIGQSFRDSQTEFIVLLMTACFMFTVGLIDDLHPLRGRTKLLCLIIASLAISASGATIRSISVGPWFELKTGLLAWPLAVFWIVVITSCINLIDGLDGLAAGIGVIVCGTMAVMAFWSGQIAMVVLMLALLGSLTGFLFFNFYPAKIFMGDGGSLFIGFMIGAGSLVCQAKTSTLVGLSIPLLVLGVPILDTGIAIIRRCIIERRSIFAPDRSHLHHRLLDLGLHQRTVVIVIYAVTAISASIGVFMLTAEGGWSMVLLAVGILVLFSMFIFLHGRRSQQILMAVKRNWSLACKIRTERRNFENVQLRMRESRSFREWWETLCIMAEQMHFQSVGLWNCRDGDYKITCAWSAPEVAFTTGKTVKISIPFNGNGVTEWEMRARIWVDDHLELSGRHAMLLTRLMDEFPPPAQQEEDEAFDLHSDTMHRSMIEERAETSILTMTSSQALKISKSIPTPLNIMGIPVVPFESYDHAIECIEETIESDQKSFWIAINPIKIYNAWHKPDLLNLLRQADVGICDGVGVSIASKILHGRSIKRCTGCDLFFKLISLASRKGWGIYMLGASAKSNASARLRLQKMCPGLRIVGWQDGYFKDSRKVIEQINSSGANLLFVAMGSPKQEYWIRRHRKDIEANFCMGVGGSFDIASGGLMRAPKIFRITGTEFLFRLAREPVKRLSNQKLLLYFLLRVVGRKLSGTHTPIEWA